MPLNVWQRNITDEHGNVISSAEIEVFYAGSTSKPVLKSSPAGASLTNPFDANASGFAQFYAIDGYYDIAVNGDVIWSDVQIGTGIYDNVSALTAAVATLPVGSTVSTKGAVTTGDGGHGTFDIVASTSLAVDGYSVIGAGPYAILRTAAGEIDARCLGYFADGTNETAAMVRCVNFSHSTGAEIVLPLGVGLTDQILIDAKTFRVRGRGRHLSTIKLRPGTVAQNTIALVNQGRLYAKQLTLDGNRANQVGGHGIRSSGCDAMELTDVAILNAFSYAVGVQAGSNHGINFDNVLVDGCGEDGMDFKDKNYNNSCIKLNNITVRNYGSASTSSGIDFRGEVQATNIKIFMSADRKGFRFRLDDGVQGRSGFGTVTNLDVRTEGANIDVGYAIQIEGASRNYAFNNVTVNGIGGAVLLGGDARGGAFNNIAATNVIEFASIFGRDTVFNNVQASSGTGSLRLIDFEPGCDNISFNSFGLDETTPVTTAVRVQSGATRINMSNGWIRGGNIAGDMAQVTQSNVRLI